MPFHCSSKTRRDRPDEEALADRVDRAEELGELRPEVQRDDADEADDDADHGEAGEADLRLAGRPGGRRRRGVIQPTVALASSSTNSTAVAMIEPRTVIMPGRHGLTGPSVIGVVVVPALAGGPHTVPPGLGDVGAAQPVRASSKVLSLRIGLGTRLPSHGAPPRRVGKSSHRLRACGYSAGGSHVVSPPRWRHGWRAIAAGDRRVRHREPRWPPAV